MNSEVMIDVCDLTKRYAGHTAIENLTFSVRKGEIVGLVGPNGAGKSTTMRILSSYLSATSGTARVAGYDVFTQSREVRQNIGYMPENNPLPYDMRIREYLKFRAHLKGLSTVRARNRISIVMEQCGLTDVSHRIIGQLSMGYRQRVGLADALVHEPQLIILDEPTLGLDPNQIRAVRTLIKKLGGQHTVLISTHILPEVEMTCNRVLILHQGRILASDTPMNLQAVLSQSGQIIVEIKAPKSELIDFFSDFEPLESYEISTSEGDYFRCTLIPSTSIDLRPLIFEEVCTRKWALRELSGCRPTLEDVFVHMTRTKLEEE